MSLSPEEVAFMERGGTKLRPDAGFDSSKDLYTLSSDCGWLNDDGSCSAYTDPERPDACRDFTPGKAACVLMRLDSGVPTELPEEILEQVPVFEVDERIGIAFITPLCMRALTTF
jgi:hypothetical protein